ESRWLHVGRVDSVAIARSAFIGAVRVARSVTFGARPLPLTMRPLAKLVVLLGTLLLLVSCPAKKKGAYVIDPDDTAPPTTAQTESGLVIRLGHADASADARPPVRVAKA